jgi:hypothetical protein
MRQATRLQVAKARTLASGRQLENALNAAAICFDVGQHASSSTPNLIGHLVEVAIDAIALRGVADIIDGRECPRQASAALRSRLRETDLVSSSIRALEGEAASGLLTIDQMPELVRRERQQGRGPTAPRGLSPVDWMAGASRAYYVKSMNDYIELAPLPYRQSRQRCAELEAQASRMPSYAMLVEILLPALTGAAARRDQMVAHINLCIVALDLKAYKHERGEYPETLDGLPEASEESYAGDVFTGKPFKYRREGEGFLLYSFGKDLDDDGGLALGREVNGKPEWDDGDLVWRCRN